MNNNTVTKMADAIRDKESWNDVELSLADYSPSLSTIQANWTKKASREAYEILTGKTLYSAVYDRDLRMFECADKNPDSPMFGRAKALFEKYIKDLNGFLHAGGYRVDDHVLTPLRHFGAKE